MPMDRERKNGPESPPQCSQVERYLSERIDSVRQQLANNQASIAQLAEDLDRHVNQIWTDMRKSMADLTKQLSDHAKDDSEAMHTVQTQLLTRVPAWALGLMTAGASIIGAMAMYILDHSK